jgi:transglutaminase-like putative cysteine protease
MRSRRWRTRRMEGWLKRDTVETHIAALETLDHRAVDWTNVRWTAYLIHQHFRYEYPGDIHDLRQRLMIVPPERHGGQRLVTHKLEVSAPFVDVGRTEDQFGNRVLDLFVEHVERAIDFTAWIVVERDVTQDPARLPADTDLTPFLEPSPLTMPDDAFRAAAEQLRAEADEPAALAGRINEWVHSALTYAHGITSVKTPAADALAAGRGVCQDYAHIMLALCRLCGLPARYVSGHLLGEGGTHAWVDVLLPDPEHLGGYLTQPYDPTNGCIPGLKYLTIAVGRDYRDVAPTSGTFRAPYAGHLTAHKRAGITDLAYFSTESN